MTILEQRDKPIALADPNLPLLDRKQRDEGENEDDLNLDTVLFVDKNGTNTRILTSQIESLEYETCSRI